jgi:hypothetical protein
MEKEGDIKEDTFESFILSGLLAACDGKRI